jgi:hypothetical protein
MFLHGNSRNSAGQGLIYIPITSHAVQETYAHVDATSVLTSTGLAPHDDGWWFDGRHQTRAVQGFWPRIRARCACGAPDSQSLAPWKRTVPEPNFRAFGKHVSGSVNFGLRTPQQLLVRVLLLRQTPFYAGTSYPVAKITAVRTTLGIEQQCALLACRRGQVLGICTGTYDRRACGCVPSALAISVPCNVMGARWGRGWPGGNPTSPLMRWLFG